MNVNIDFGAIKEKVGTVAQAGVAQTKKVVTIAKLKADNMAQQDAVRKAYFAIGKLYYAKSKGAPDEEFAELFAKADAALAAIAANNAALEEMKATEEVVIDVEMQAGEMPEDVEPTVEDVVADVQETVAEVVAEEAPVEEAPEEEAPAEAVPEESAEDEMSNGKAE